MTRIRQQRIVHQRPKLFALQGRIAVFFAKQPERFAKRIEVDVQTVTVAVCCQNASVAVVNFPADARLQNSPQALSVAEFVVQVKLPVLPVDDTDEQNEK